MTFGAPSQFLWLIAIPIFVFLMWSGEQSARKRMSKLLSPNLLPTLVDSPLKWLRTIRQTCLLLAITFFIITLARPQWGVTQETVEFRGRDILIAIDTSRSMLATDVSPSRLGRAKLAAEDLLTSLPDERIGLLAFAGEAEVQAPLTTDRETIVDTLNHLDTNSIARGGTDIAAAIRAAELALGQKSKSLRALVLLTDGEELDEDGIEAARRAAQSGIRIFTIGVGTPSGSQIFLSNGQPLRDRDGTIVVSRLDEARLKSIAEVTGGFYLRLTPTTASRVVSEGLLHLGDANLINRSLTKPIERYQWPLAFGVLFLFAALATADRLKKVPLSLKQTAAIVLLSFTLLISARAAAPLDLYRSGDYEAALDLWQEELKKNPHDPVLNLNAGNAAYRLEKFDQAFESYSEALNSPDTRLREDAYYNSGNALFKAGDNQEDIERQLVNYYDAKYLYEQALDLDPNDAAAKKNLDLLLQRIKEAEEQKKFEQQRQKSQSAGGQKRKSQGKPSDQNESGSSRRDQNQPDENSDSQEGKGANGENQAPTPNKKKEGDLREAQPREPNPQVGQDAQPGDGKMSREEAFGLLDSLRGEEDHVNLSKRKREKPVGRDW